MPRYRSLFDCISASPDFAGYPETRDDLVTWANSEIGVLQERIPPTEVWNAILDNKSADYDALTDDEKTTILNTLSIYSQNQEQVKTAAGNSFRDYLLSIFGGGSNTIQDLVSKFTVQTQRARTYGWTYGTVEGVDIDEAINRFGG